MLIDRIRPEKQVYKNYTEEDFKVWKTLFNRQYESIILHGAKDYLEALRKIQFTPERIPDFLEINGLLNNFTGWKLETVPCISPPQTFFKFPRVAWSR